MRTQKSENKQQLFFEANSLLFCASFVLSQIERYIRPIKSHLFVCQFFKKFEILLLFASNKFEEEDFKKRTKKDFAFQTCARARCFVVGVEKRVGGRDTIRVAAVWQRSRGGLFRFFEEEEEEKAKKFRE